jgi:RimJ/RimL family protein N-acetyltransferase
MPARRPSSTASRSAESGVVRRLGPADAAAYRTLMLRAFARHPEAFTSTAAERAREPLSQWKARVSRAPDALATVWGAFVGNELAGVIGLERNRREKTRHKATVFGLFVARKFRRRQIGRLLLQAVLAAARERGDLRALQLTVTEQNAAARRLYEQAGFRAWGAEPDAMRWRGRRWVKVHYALALD